MPKYIKKEIADLNGTGSTQACYRMQTWRKLEFDEFVKRCHTFNGAFSDSAIKGVVTAVCDQLAREIANGYNVKIDGLGTFGCRLGLRPNKDMDGFAEGEVRRNAQSIIVKGVSFRVDKELVRNINMECDLERGGESRLRKSEYTQTERLQLALEFIEKQGYMRVAHYAALTGLSYPTAARELVRLADDPNSGITSQGSKSAKIYIKKPR